MAQELDSNWEYYNPDPEIVDVLFTNKLPKVFELPRHDEEVIFRLIRKWKSPSRSREWRGRNLANSRKIFSELWLLGYSCQQIADVMGFKCIHTVKNWRRELKLPRRMNGRCADKEKQIEYMRRQLQQ